MEGNAEGHPGQGSRDQAAGQELSRRGQRQRAEAPAASSPHLILTPHQGRTTDSAALSLETQVCRAQVLLQSFTSVSSHSQEQERSIL